jgi:hypothetical protein
MIQSGLTLRAERTERAERAEREKGGHGRRLIVSCTANAPRIGAKKPAFGGLFTGSAAFLAGG